MSALNATANPNSMARSGAFYILSVALFPVVLAGVITAIVFLTGVVAPSDGVSHKTKYAHIHYPNPGDLVSSKFTVSGTLDHVPVGTVVYLVERADSRFWPKKKLDTSVSSFSRQQDASDGKGHKYTIELLALDVSALARIEAWFETGRKTGKYPGLTDMAGAQVLARTRVMR